MPREAALRRIHVANVPDYGVEEVADTTLCLLLNLLRRTTAASMRDGVWIVCLICFV
jgi:D-3-phosphoglycerate dehydrogenase